MSEHAAVAFLRDAHTRAEEVARAAKEPAVLLWPTHPVEFLLAGQEVTTPETRAAEAHIRMHMPEAVLRRVDAERAVLGDHAEVEGGCAVCAEAGSAARLAWPCPTVVGLARAWGWA
ncbi:DUF6221 family protein [Streptacidiphilus jiangxiensis]|uniref:Uncharacterized protein n=1 Tax=Streptacidiphilus jiangxiensis TaxID=235985 RepID=A0A1H7XN09_STRJI|nr:DUF6221 family protein [Streptacidiphilus jiangxiensis]SEM35033.1 hypothetical protein SAMN05414137_124119 [Streptacidiphilus jiangxiensis]